MSVTPAHDPARKADIPKERASGTVTPVEIQRRNDPGQEGIQIRWSDGLESFLSNRLLRTSCPCATCEESRGSRSHAQPLSSPRPLAPESGAAAEVAGPSSTGTGGPSGRGLLKVLRSTAAEELTLKNITAVGNYAISLLWGDGHDSGIYSYVLLRDLSERSAGEPQSS